MVIVSIVISCLELVFYSSEKGLTNLVRPSLAASEGGLEVRSEEW